jgi:pimeloyl-ACP methyl ester carboxylesterase
MSAKKISLPFIQDKFSFFLLLFFATSYSQLFGQYTMLKSESVDIAGRKYVLQTGELVVAEDRTVASSRLLTLPVQILKAANSTTAEPIFWLDGVDINRYIIIDVIEDIEQARKALGYSSINLLSVSYGTRVALLYSYKYPAAIKRTVMIGACPPGYFLTRPEQVENAILVYDSIYKSQTGDEYKGSILEAMKKALDNLPKRWSAFALDADKIKAGTVGALYSRGFAVWAFHSYFKAANEGDYSNLYMLQKIYEMNTISAIGDVYAKTVSADMEDSMSSGLLRESLRQSNTILGNNISVLYGSTAHAWSIASIPEEFKRCKTSKSETLVISGDLDFRTPANITNRELIPYLVNGKHIVLKNMSHTDILANVMKSQDFLHQYFELGRVEESLITPIASIDFKAGVSIGKLKIFFAGLLL